MLQREDNSANQLCISRYLAYREKSIKSHLQRTFLIDNECIRVCQLFFRNWLAEVSQSTSIRPVEGKPTVVVLSSVNYCFVEVK